MNTIAHDAPTFSGMLPASEASPAPEIDASEWLNTPRALRWETLRGRVVVLHAFQMLCPGCVTHGLPQMRELQATFAPRRVALIGLHSVFEHHEVMTAAALRAFAHEYRLTFPIAIDRAGEGGETPLPKTMQAYELRGTPSLLLIDAAGRLRAHWFGRVSDLELGAAIGQLCTEA